MPSANRLSRSGMKRHGWEVGRNLLVDYRGGQADPEMHFTNAKALVESNVDLIVAQDNMPMAAAFRATRKVPIVMFGLGAVEYGYASSLSRPGGNVTGVATLALEANGKPMEMMKAMRPDFAKLGVPVDPRQAINPGVDMMRTAGQRLGVTVVTLPDFRDMAGVAPMLAAAKREGVQALALGARLAVILRGEGNRRIQAWANENKVMTWGGNWQRGQLLLSVGPSLPHLEAALCRQIDQVLRGAAPAEIPIEEPRVYDVIINRRIAKATGLAIPHSVLLQATEVID